MYLSTFARRATAGLFALAAVGGHAGTGTIQDVKHVVILMQENRSFDHYCGCMAGVRGFGDRNPMTLANGQSDFYQPLGDGSTNSILPFPVTAQCINDVDHDHSSGLADWDNGKWDQWIPAKGSETMCYYTPDYLPLHQALASSYTICDNYFCSLIGPTYPNRLFMFTGTIDPNGTAGGPALANMVPSTGFTWTTYPELLQGAGVSWRVYRPAGDWFGDVLPWFAQYMNAAPGNPLYDRGVAEVPDAAAALLADVTNGTLPQVSWVIPPYALSEHPTYSPASGENFIKSIVDALASNPDVLNSTVFILTYDENDGFYDHVPSPIAPPGTTNEFVGGQPLGLGVRVPTFIISPWSRGGRVCSQVFDHTSIIRFLETWTGVQDTNISAWRRQVCGDLTSAFDFAHPNTTNYPVLPNVAQFFASYSTPVPPSVPGLPLQPPAPSPAMPLPYQPEITAQTDCAAQQVHLTLTNAGSASVHFAIYANPVQSGGPQQCDVLPGAALTESFRVNTNYDLSCCGPNGFQRRFTGSLAADCGQIEAASTIATNAGTMTVKLQNSTANAVQFILTDNYGLGGPWAATVAGNSAISQTFFALAQNNGWYDLTVTASSDASFLRHFTGHIETGAIMTTEPVLQPPNSAPPLFAGMTGLAVSPNVTSLLASLPPVPGPGSLPCYATGMSTNLVLVYPGWASNYTVLASSTLAPGSWAPMKASLTNMGNYTLAMLPCSSNVMFFRLRQ